MPYNGSGIYELPSTTVTPAVTSTTIDSAEFNTFTADLATALSLCLTEDGQNVPTANLPMSTYKHTGVGASAALTDYVRVQELQNNTHLWGGTAGGTADVQTVTLAPAISGLVTGQEFSFKPVADNTGACTINVNSKGAKSVKLNDGNDPYAGALDATGISKCLDDGTNYILLNPADVKGTWTPELAFGGDTTGMGYASNDGVYELSNGFVTATAFVQLNAKGTGAGAATVITLPIVSAATYNNPVTVRLNAVSFVDAFQATVPPASSSVFLEEITAAGVKTGLDDTNFATNSEVMITVTYPI